MLTRPAARILNLFKVILENLPVDFRAEMMYTRFARSAFAHAHAVIKETRGMDKMRTDNVKMSLINMPKKTANILIQAL